MSGAGGTRDRLAERAGQPVAGGTAGTLDGTARAASPSCARTDAPANRSAGADVPAWLGNGTENTGQGSGLTSPQSAGIRMPLHQIAAFFFEKLPLLPVAA